MTTLAEGDKAPDFDLPTDGGGTIRLSGLNGGKVILYFYPADDTTGCTTEAVDFTAALPEFKRAGFVIFQGCRNPHGSVELKRIVLAPKGFVLADGLVEGSRLRMGQALMRAAA